MQGQASMTVTQLYNMHPIGLEPTYIPSEGKTLSIKIRVQPILLYNTGDTNTSATPFKDILLFLKKKKQKNFYKCWTMSNTEHLLL